MKSRIIVLSLLVAALYTSAALGVEQADSPPIDLIADPYGRDGHPWPLALINAAWSNACTFSDNASNRITYARAFSAGFRAVLVQPEYAEVDEHGIPPDEPFERGHEAGKETAARADENPLLRDLSPVDFGYTNVTRTGTVRIGAEQCAFYPDDIEERWWLRPSRELLNECRRLDLASESPLPPVRQYRATLSGWLTRTNSAGYGHMGWYHRHFTPREVNWIKPNIQDTQHPTKPLTTTE